MLSFAVYSNGKPATDIDLSGAYLVGSDDVPLRAEISFHDGVITCTKRVAGPAGLAILWEVPGIGTNLLDTIRLLEREKPYILEVELARARLMRIQHKLEDWGLLAFAGAEEIGQRVMQGREALIHALQADSPAQAAKRAGEALSIAIKASEDLARFHAGQFLAMRKQAGAFGRRVFGCSILEEKPTDMVCKRLASAFDMVTIPVVWRDIEPTEQKFCWDTLDKWVEKLSKYNVALNACSLLSFNEKHVPDWLFIWEHDFDTIRDFAYEHARRVLDRYGKYIQVWDVISGIHANNCFTFSFEQLMELTRMTASLTKKICPDAVAVVDLVAPWGEYYAKNQRTIPPLLYADMTVQSGVNFDAFGLKFQFGSAEDGMLMRDMFQISTLLDVFVKLGKPVHVTAVQVPSEDDVPASSGGSPGEPASRAGAWHEPWSEKTQSEWLGEFLETALSKPVVESVSWHGLSDHKDRTIPHGGLLSSKLVTKPAFDRWVKIRSEVLSAVKKSNRGSAA